MPKPASSSKLVAILPSFTLIDAVPYIELTKAFEECRLPVTSKFALSIPFAFISSPTDARIFPKSQPRVAPETDNRSGVLKRSILVSS